MARAAQLAALHQAIQDNSLPAVKQLLEDDPDLSSQANVRDENIHFTNTCTRILYIYAYIYVFTLHMHIHLRSMSVCKCLYSNYVVLTRTCIHDVSRFIVLNKENVHDPDLRSQANVHAEHAGKWHNQYTHAYM